MATAGTAGIAVRGPVPPACSARLLEDGCRRITIVSGGKNHMRDYVADILQEARPASAGDGNVAAAAVGGGAAAAGRLPRPVLLRGRLRAMSKAISVAEVAKRCALERGFVATSTVELTGMADDGERRRDAPEIYIRLDFHVAAGMDLEPRPS